MSDPDVGARIEAVRRSFAASRVPTANVQGRKSMGKPNVTRPQSARATPSQTAQLSGGYVSHSPTSSPQGNPKQVGQSTRSGLVQPNHGTLTSRPLSLPRAKSTQGRLAKSGTPAQPGHGMTMSSAPAPSLQKRPSQAAPSTSGKLSQSNHGFAEHAPNVGPQRPMATATTSGRLAHKVGATSPREGVALPLAASKPPAHVAGEQRPNSLKPEAPAGDTSSTLPLAGAVYPAEVLPAESPVAGKMSDSEHKESLAMEGQGKPPSEAHSPPAPASETEDAGESAKARHERKKDHKR